MVTAGNQKKRKLGHCEGLELSYESFKIQGGGKG